MRSYIGEVIEKDDVTAAEAYQELYIEYCWLNMDQIIESEKVEAL